MVNDSRMAGRCMHMCGIRLLVENYMKRCVILGTIIRIERVSSEVIILRPPEKLVIEVRVSGDYEVMFWRKGTISTFIPGQMRPQEFPNNFETFVRDNTTAEDEGFYIVFNLNTSLELLKLMTLYQLVVLLLE